jgi:TonB family protein
MGIFKAIIEMQICYAVFYLLYFMLLHRKLSFRLSRLFLLMIFPVSILIPLARIPVGESYNFIIQYFPSVFSNDSGSYMIGNYFMEMGSGMGVKYVETDNKVGLQSVFFFVYVAGALIVLLIYLYGFIKGLMIILRGKKGIISGREVILADCNGGAFSMMGRVVIDKHFAENDASSLIINHEYLHKQYIHSADLFFMLLTKITFWFNPFVWIADRSLRQLHEYEVDANMILSGVNPKQYAQLLLDYEMGIIVPATVNQFSYLSIKNRLKMMKKNSHKSSLRILYALPVAILMIAMFSLAPQSCKSNQDNKETQKNIIPEEQQPIAEEVKPDSTSSEIVKTEQKESIGYVAVEVKPTFQGGDQNSFTKWVFENITYPESAKQKGISGRVTLKFTIAEDGSIVDVKILKGISKELDAEAIRVVSASPKWTPGKHNGKAVPVTMVFPIIFQLK